MSYKDLRDWIDQAEKMGELIHLNGVDWNLEIGVLADLSKKAILFDNIKDYPKGYRVLTGQSESKALSELTYGFARPQGSHTDLVNFWRKWLKGARPVPVKVVRDGAVMENVHRIDDDPKSINLLEFPVPKWHEGDGGRYIGTAGCCILRDTDENWVNMGIFRIMVSDPQTMTLYICQGKNSHIIIEKAFRRGQNVPVVVLAGQDPAVWAAGTWGVWGESDLEYAGYIKGEPIEVIEGPLTGLPIPATAEIAIEGELRPGDLVTEGPYGEWTGFSEPWPVPAIRVKAIYHRNDPIHTGTLAGRGSHRPMQTGAFQHNYLTCARMWNQIEAAGVRGVTGVASYTRFLTVVSIKQMFAGHARQAGHVAAQLTEYSMMTHYIIVVDDDIDPYNIAAVMWAVAVRSNPERAIDIIRYCWSDRMDTAIPIEEKIGKSFQRSNYIPVFNSRAIIDACKPFEWNPNIKQSIEHRPELVQQVLDKWGKFLKDVYKD